MRLLPVPSTSLKLNPPLTRIKPYHDQMMQTQHCWVQVDPMLRLTPTLYWATVLVVCARSRLSIPGQDLGSRCSWSSLALTAHAQLSLS